jgi:hypothetical protein
MYAHGGFFETQVTAAVFSQGRMAVFHSGYENIHFCLVPSNVLVVIMLKNAF